jgi:SAM-dependent methyltransferase
VQSIGEVATYWNQRPCNIRHSGLKPMSLAWSRDVMQRKYFVEPHISRFADFKRWDGKRVLEIGCGIGTDTIQFMRNGADIEAIDLSIESVKIARARIASEFPDHRYRGAVWCQNAEAELPLGPFDLIYSFGVLHHTPHPDRVLKLARSRLKPGGELRIMVYAKWSLKHLLRGQPEAQAGCPIVRHYTKEEVVGLLFDAGFLLTSIEKAHIFPYRVKDYVEYRYVKHLPFRLLPRPVFSWLETVLGNHLLVVARKA